MGRRKEKGGRTRAPRSLLFGVGAWIVLGLFYWWLIAKSHAQQFVAAALVGAVAATAVSLVRAAVDLHFVVPVVALGRIAPRLAKQIVRDLGLLAAALGHAMTRPGEVTGAVKQLRFEPGNSGPAAIGRRAFVLAAVSTPPNSIALDVERDRRALLVHQLVFEAKAPKNPEWPV